MDAMAKESPEDGGGTAAAGWMMRASAKEDSLAYALIGHKPLLWCHSCLVLPANLKLPPFVGRAPA
jgi:hypothetical protein